MKPGTAYRAAVVLAGLGAVLTILAALDEMWLLTACGVLSVTSGLQRTQRPPSRNRLGRTAHVPRAARAGA